MDERRVIELNGTVHLEWQHRGCLYARHCLLVDVIRVNYHGWTMRWNCHVAVVTARELYWQWRHLLLTTRLTAALFHWTGQLIDVFVVVVALTLYLRLLWLH